MMGLMTRMACSAQAARLDADHSNHFASSVRTSSMTLLSTRTSATLVSGQRHNFVSREFYRPFPAKVGNQLMPTVRASFLLSDAHSVSHDVESHFGVRKQPEPFPDVLWNGDLSLRCYTHSFLLLLLILLLPNREIKAVPAPCFINSGYKHGRATSVSWMNSLEACVSAKEQF